ncbi:MAG: PBP1A family penicillin-binding protein [Desulfobacterales bacterium]|nr:PBP1A family penicillin-binding protein [Desulfobacterales bacterium]
MSDKNKPKKKRNIFLRLFKWLFWSVFISGFIGVIILGTYIYYLYQDLPKIYSLNDYRPPIVTSIFSDDGTVIAEFFKERRIIIPVKDISQKLKRAFIAAEDSRFFKHQGIDVISIIRAAFKNIEAGAIVQGGSTITQQVAKSFFLSPERSFNRKLKEAILAYQIDRNFEKEQILYLYLNQIYLGHGAYGVESAAENYFGKKTAELNLAECAILAGLPQAPSKYSPFRHPERAKDRQLYVLNRMIEEGYITKEEAEEAKAFELDIKPRRNLYIENVPYYTEHVRQTIEKKYGRDALYLEGLKIYTAVNIEMQNIAQEEIQKGLYDLDKRQGYRGPIKNIPMEEIESYSQSIQNEFPDDSFIEGNIVKGIVISIDASAKVASIRMGGKRGLLKISDMRWARKPNSEVAYYEARIRKIEDVLQVYDVIFVKLKNMLKDEQLWEVSLEQEPSAQSALMAIETGTGNVKVMIGGKDFRESQFNRATQSRRQPGSSFKPIVYAAAIDKGYTPASIIYDTAFTFNDPENDLKWKPKNYHETFYGPTPMRTALAKSLNVATIKILKDIGIGYAIDYARKLGINSNLNRDLSIALGSSGVSLLEMLTAYSIFANQGYLIEPVFITKVVDRNGNVLEEANYEAKKVIEDTTAYIITSLLESVVKDGTGKRVKALNRPVAGKTGTTNDLNDAWFIGYTPDYVTGVWVGFDNEQSLGKGETGSRAASPIWLEFMKRILEDKPIKVFQIPNGIVFSRIDPKTGLLASPDASDSVFECFKAGTAPTKTVQKSDNITDKDIFYKLGM